MSGMSSSFTGPGANQAKLQFPYPVKIAWDLKKSTRYTSCHEKVHDAAARIFDRVLDHYGLEKISLLKLDTFGGCLTCARSAEVLHGRCTHGASLSTLTLIGIN